jgi:hypothetical protein
MQFNTLPYLQALPADLGGLQPHARAAKKRGPTIANLQGKVCARPFAEGAEVALRVDIVM